MSTPFHAAYWAHALTLEGAPGTIESLSRSLGSARVDLNPHQVDAALFAIQAPLSSRGVLLADEVGLGKTIEAGLVIAQRWAERKRRILLILPATLRKQWQQELADKFALPSTIHDAASYRAQRAACIPSPLDSTAALHLCSYQFAAARKLEIALVPWDLVVIDEAHRLRNVYKGTSKIAQAIKDALPGRMKLLLTATPLQNSLLELYGLVSMLDEYVFCDVENFRDRFVRAPNETRRNEELRERLLPLCRRTLRKQVLEYVRFTKRIPITQRFTPTDAEQRLYDEVSAYLQREVLFALPRGQRMLLTMVLRKLLASSTYAIAGTLHQMVQRLGRVEQKAADQLLDEQDFEAIGELADEWSETDSAAKDEAIVDLEALRAELEELRRYAEEADSIEHNAKGEALVLALETGLAKAESLGAARKAVIFTESRRTQAYLARLLGANGYAGRIVLMNGSNSDAESRAIYRAWLDRHRGSDKLSGVRAADMKAALVEELEERSTLLVATESAAEGVNLQFCSLVVNYDLPWNPQRIEQRIGRCHRYGQRHDVVVVNFLNERNAADQRVFQLLDEKFRLFEGVFGASDEILGAVESGVDIERRILEVYQSCRTPADIQAAFDRLQADLEGQIDETMAVTRRAILEHFDAEVQKRLRGVKGDAERMLLGNQGLLWNLVRHELKDQARFDEVQKSFDLPDDDRRAYYLSWPVADEQNGVFFHPDHELATRILAEAKARPLGPVRLLFEYRTPPRHAALEPHLGRSGWLELLRLRVAGRNAEEHLVALARLEGDEELPPEVAIKLFELPAREEPSRTSASPSLDALRASATAAVVDAARARNEQALRAEELKLEQWAEDAKQGLERELKELDREIREARKASRLAATLAEKLDLQKRVKDLEGRRSRKRRELFDQQDRIEADRDKLISDIEHQLELSVSSATLFAVPFTLDDRRATTSE